MGNIKRLMAEQEAAHDEAAVAAYLQGLIDAGQVPRETQDIEGVRRGPPHEELYFTDCTRCAQPMPPGELVEALDNGGLCAYCEHMESKD